MIKYTYWFVFAVIFAIAGYDVWVISTYGNENSISAYFLALGEVTPFFHLMLMYTMGHLTAPRYSKLIHSTLSYNYLSISFFMIFAPLMVFDLWQIHTDGDVIFPNYNLPHIVPSVIGYFMGWAIWPMNPKSWSGIFKDDEK